MKDTTISSTEKTFKQTLLAGCKSAGSKSVAYDLGVSDAVVRMWRSGSHLPKFTTQVGIIYVLNNPKSPLLFLEAY